MTLSLSGAMLAATAFVCPSAQSFSAHDFQGRDSACRPLPQGRVVGHQSDARFSSPASVRNCGAGFLLARPRFSIRQLPGSNRSADILARDKQAFQDLCHRAVPHRRCLSPISVSVGIDPNENGLTHAQASFAPGAKAYD